MSESMEMRGMDRVRTSIACRWLRHVGQVPVGLSPSTTLVPCAVPFLADVRSAPSEDR